MRFVRFLICSQSMAEPRRKQSDVIDLLFFNRKIDQLNDYLTENPNLDLMELLDSQGNTVLHQLAYEGHLDIIKLFVRYARKTLQRRANQKKQLYQKQETSAITTWTNHRNNEGFTPLLYASYSGHIDIIRYFVEDLQVNERLTTNSGVNPLHLAAQKNVLLPFLYFRSRIDINQEDNLGDTALHWAAYLNSEQVVAYLLAEPSLSCLDKKDNDGNTPLMNAASYGNTRIVRRLLISGANRNLRNAAGKTPLEVSIQNEYHTISKMLNEDYSFADLISFYCNVKIQYRPKKRKMTLPIVFIFTFALALTILNTLLKFQHQYGLLVQCVGMGLLLLIYLTLLPGPSKPTPKNHQEFLLSSQKNLKKVCFQCKNGIPKRGYHCDTCGVCIRQYDHHCTWINNCVGKRNLARFIFFLFFLVIALGFIGLVSFLGGLCVALEDPQLYAEWLILRNPYETDLEKYLVLGMLGFNCLVSVFILPVLMLLLFQIKNLLKNKTSYEIMRGPPEQENPIKEKIRRYNSRVSLRNCKHMCRDNSTTSSRTSFKSEEQITDKLLSQKNHTK